jgi:hypothetical protein
MIVACAADKRQGYFWDLESQVGRAGLDFHFERLDPFTWAGMLEWERDFCRTTKHDKVVFVDAWDFLMLGTSAELGSLLSEQDVLFHSDAHCWPEPHKADLYPPSPHKYRYVNGTGPAGNPAAIADLIEFGQHAFPVRGRESSIFADNDQRFWTDVYLSDYWVGKYVLGVDVDRRLSLSLNCTGREDFSIVGKRVITFPQGTSPVFLHANGASKFTYALDLMGLR